MAALARRSVPATADILASAPRGAGAPILVLPGVFRTDAQTSGLRDLLSQLGYTPFGWELGRNLGPTQKLMRGARLRLQQLAATHGPVVLIGFSMGGLFARWLAIRDPGLVQQVITIGSPWRAPVQSVYVPAALVRLAWRNRNLDTMAADIAGAMPVPVTSLFSRRDGIVAWESCLDPEAHHANVEVHCPHVMMEQDTHVFRAVAEALALASPG
jgi:pimeloyl-ACP methyl ester carboxylesterase